ncbi:hypothetical protein [Rhodobacteraceae phage LS06-2018-MD07]|jgi:regulator of replication initiation timing|nr:hypothetical protein [Rhodobacteraceae phage LS06-2018-MD07]
MNIDVDALKKLDVDLLLDLLIKQLEIGQAAAKQGHDELIDLRQENARLEAENDELMNGISKIQKHRADEEERAANLREALWKIVDISVRDPNNWAQMYQDCYHIALDAMEKDDSFRDNNYFQELTNAELMKELRERFA